MKLVDDADRLRRRYEHDTQFGYEIRPAFRPDTSRDYLFELAGGIVTIAAVSLAFLMVLNICWSLVYRWIHPGA